MLRDRAKKALYKKAKKGFRGFPQAAVAFYGPTAAKASKMVVSIFVDKDSEPEPMRKWFTENDVRHDAEVLTEVLAFLRDNEVRSVSMVDKIIGCPHEEGIDYPQNEACPQCPYWKNRDRFTGKLMH